MYGNFSKLLLSATVALLVLTAARPAAAESPNTGLVGGGGTAVLDDTFPEFIGIETKFGLGAAINADGTASGDFQCVVAGPQGLVLMMKVTHGVRTGDDTATLSGPGAVQFQGGGLLLFDFALDVQAGGPGVGGFRLYGDGWSAPQGDHETLLSGKITIK